MAPYSQRRHRLNPDEIEPVMWAAYEKLLRLLDKEASGTLEVAQSLFRLWYRISRYVRNKPAYPPHETWPEMHIWMEYGEDSLDSYGDEKGGGAWCCAPRGALPTRIAEAEAKAPVVETWKISGAAGVDEETGRLGRRDEVE